MKKLLLILCIASVFVFVLVMFQKKQRSGPAPLVQSLTPTPRILSGSPTPSPAQTPEGWQTYASSVHGFSMSHPPDVTVSDTGEGTRFLMLGKTQSPGTELYDGIAVVIKSDTLGGVSFDEFVRNEYERTKNDETTARISELESLTLSGKPGYTFVLGSLGDATLIYLPKSEDRFLLVIDRTAEPNGSQNSYRDTVAQMLNSLSW